MKRRHGPFLGNVGMRDRCGFAFDLSRSLGPICWGTQFLRREEPCFQGLPSLREGRPHHGESCVGQLDSKGGRGRPAPGLLTRIGVNWSLPGTFMRARRALVRVQAGPWGVSSSCGPPCLALELPAWHSCEVAGERSPFLRVQGGPSAQWPGSQQRLASSPAPGSPKVSQLGSPLPHDTPGDQASGSCLCQLSWLQV